MTPLSIEEMRRWCFGYTKRGKGLKQLQEFDREIATNALLRHIGWNPQDFFKWIHGQEKIPKRVRPLLARFIADWEAGKVAFTAPGHGHRRHLVRLEKPVRRVRLAVPFAGDAPKLQFLERRQAPARMPEFRDLIRPNLRSRSG